MESKVLAICGTYRRLAPEELNNREVWSVGKTSLARADRFYELHGLPSREPRYDYTNIPPEVYTDLPVGNSVAMMLAHACYEARWERVEVLASPLSTRQEYVNERASVAFFLGILHAKGVEVYWEGGGLDFTHQYGRQK